jgi:SAM-dependent methyltransferase
MFYLKEEANLVKSYRAIQQWNHWLNDFLGFALLEAENRLLLKFLEHYYGKHAVLIGVPNQYSLLQSNQILDRVLLSPIAIHDKTTRSIEGDWNELPISSGSVDLVVLPHSLEYVDNPRQVLSEACRIVKPEGALVIFGFNPYSFWGLQGTWDKLRGHTPWIGKRACLSANLIKKWLALADFELLKQKALLFRPPLQHKKIFQKLKMMEWIGDKCYLPFGGAYVLMAKAKVVPLTPIRLYWKQQLAGIKLTIPGSTMRNS